MKSKTFLKTIETIVDTGRLVDPEKWTVQDAISKLFEEGGEFSQAVQTKVGKLNKPLEEDADFDECADTVMCAIDVLSQANLDMSKNDLLEKLRRSLDKKTIKWLQKIDHTRKS